MAKIKDWGALLAFLSLLLGGAIGWGKITAQLEDHGKRLDKAEPAIQQNTTDDAVLKAAVEDIRDTVHRIEGRQ